MTMALSGRINQLQLYQHLSLINYNSFLTSISSYIPAINTTSNPQLQQLWREIYMSHDILDLQGRRPEETPKEDNKADPQEDVECVDTKVWLWDGEEYEEFQSDYLNQIFPYKLNKKTVSNGAQFVFHFLSSSLHYWVEMQLEHPPQPQKLSPKDSKVISEILETDESDNWIAFRRWGKNYDKRDAFMKLEQQQESFVAPKGELLHTYTRGEDEYEIVKYFGNDADFTPFKERLEVLLLFYIDGVSFVFETIDTWQYYLIFKKLPGKTRKNVVGMLSKYVFRLSALKERHRISQVFILPPYQKHGHGKELLDLVYSRSLKDPQCFEITTEIPSFEYQCLRDFKELELLLGEKIVDLTKLVKVVDKKEIQENRAILLSKDNVREIKSRLKIPGHQIQRLANILIYHSICQQAEDLPKAHFQQELRDHIIINRSPFKTRRKLPHITFYGQVPNLKEFLIEKAKEDLLRNTDEVQEILTETINGYNRVINKLNKTHLLS